MKKHGYGWHVWGLRTGREEGRLTTGGTGGRDQWVHESSHREWIDAEKERVRMTVANPGVSFAVLSCGPEQ